MLRPLLLSALCLTLFTTAASADDDAPWIPLFDGQTLDGWVANLGSRGDETSQDVDEIFTVRDGTLHIYADAAPGSVQYNANLRTTRKFSRYRLQVEYRWLENRFRPRHAAVRDAGILFHVHTNIDAVWPSSLEMQLGAGQPGDPYVTGDLWVIGQTRARSRSTNQRYDPAGDLIDFGFRASPDDPIKRSNYTPVVVEPKTRGEWQRAEIVVHGADRAEFYLNGVLMNVITDFRYQAEDGSLQPLTEGYISLQAEWAELQYRNIRLQPLD